MSPSSPLRTFFDDSFAALLALSPEVAAELGLRNVGGRPIAQDRLSDVSPAGDALRRAAMSATLARLRGLAPADPAEALDVELYEYFLRWANFGHLRGTESAAFAHCDLVANHLVGAQAEVINCLSQWQPLTTRDDAEAFLSRARAIPQVIDGLIESLQLRVAAGNVMPACVVGRVQAEMAKLLACSAGEHPVQRRLAAAFPDQARQLDPILQGPVASAFRRLAEYLAGYPVEPRLGLWRVPGGDDYYRFLLKAHTTTDRSAEDVHHTGRAELERLHARLNEKLAKAGCDGANLAERCTFFETREQLELGRSGDPRGAVLALLEEILRDTERTVIPLLGIQPRAGVKLAAIPQLQEPNRHHTYVAPAADGSRAGIFEVNTGALLAGTRWDLYNLVYHEAVPGHHVQLAIAQELGAGLPAFRRAVVHDGYIEGWAKYAELLPWLEGINTEPRWDIVRTRYETFSTANLVLDTGIHHRRWTREQALTFWTENTGTSAAFADYMVDRIAARPAQACAYKLGMMTMLAARRRMEQAQGERFDLRRFHDTVLGQGSLPLSVLDRLVDARIAELT